MLAQECLIYFIYGSMLKGLFALHEHWGNITSSYYSGGWNTTPERQDASKKKKPLKIIVTYLLCPSMSWEWGIWIFNIFRLIILIGG